LILKPKKIYFDQNILTACFAGIYRLIKVDQRKTGAAAATDKKAGHIDEMARHPLPPQGSDPWVG
jgi:hypothetical protein